MGHRRAARLGGLDPHTIAWRSTSDSCAVEPHEKASQIFVRDDNVRANFFSGRRAIGSFSSINAVACEAKAIAALYKEFEMDVKIRLLSDSRSAILLMNKLGPGRLRHVETRKLWLQQEVESKRLSLGHVPGVDNVADILTKPLAGARHRLLSWLLGLRQR